MSAAAARLQGLQRLRRVGALRQAQAQRLLLAARCEEFAAESELAQIAARLEGLHLEEARVAQEASDVASIAALQAAQQRGAQLRREAQTEQPLRLAAEQRVQHCRAERERAAQRLRAEQTRQDWLERACRQGQTQLRAVQAAAGQAAVFEIASARRA
jgi:hypothetical protein